MMKTPPRLAAQRADHHRPGKARRKFGAGRRAKAAAKRAAMLKKKGGAS